MNKQTMNLITFICAIVSIGIYVFTLNFLSLGFALLFSIMFIVDSLWFFIKKFFLKDKLAAIGGEAK